MEFILQMYALAPLKGLGSWFGGIPDALRGRRGSQFQFSSLKKGKRVTLSGISGVTPLPNSVSIFRSVFTVIRRTKRHVVVRFAPVPGCRTWGATGPGSEKRCGILLTPSG